MRFNGAFLRRPIVKYVDYIDVQDALRGSTAEQKEAAVRVCAGLLGIDETAALKVDPDVALPAFWTLLQYRGLTQSQKNGIAASSFEKLKATAPTMFLQVRKIMADLMSNPELYPWSLTDLELDNYISSNKTASTILSVLGFSPFAEAGVGNSFVKGLKQAFATKDARDVLKTAAKDYAIPALVLKGYASALDAAASTENLEKVRRKDRADAEKEAGDATKRAGAPPPNLIELGPPPIQKAW